MNCVVAYLYFFENYVRFKKKSPPLTTMAMSCPHRH